MSTALVVAVGVGVRVIIMGPMTYGNEAVPRRRIERFLSSVAGGARRYDEGVLVWRYSPRTRWQSRLVLASERKPMAPRFCVAGAASCNLCDLSVLAATIDQEQMRTNWQSPVCEMLWSARSSVTSVSEAR